MVKDVDYIIVGCGLAGIAFCEQLRANNKTFVVFNNYSQQSSVVAGGLYNPVILKRFTPVWLSDLQLDLAKPFYKRLEKLLHVKLDYELPVLRRFASTEEQNNWFVAADKPTLSKYLSINLQKNDNDAIDAPFDYGKVKASGRIDTAQLIKSYNDYLKEKDLLVEEQFNHDNLKQLESQVKYSSVSANYVVFAEGFGLKTNPFFNDLPLNGTKGELLTIYAPKLKLDDIVKSGVFMIPLGNDLYRVGATYEWKDKTNKITETAREELISKLKVFLKCDFKVVNQVAGIRPTVIDRKPLVGNHKEFKLMYVLNGLGTRGVMIAPYVAEQLYNYIEHKEPLNKEIDIKRF